MCSASTWGKGQYLCLVGKGWLAMEALDSALVIVYSLLIVTILLIQFGRNL